LVDESKIPDFEYHLNKEKIDYITINRDPTNITFNFETDGALTAKDALVQSANLLQEKYAEFGKLLKNMK